MLTLDWTVSLPPEAASITASVAEIDDKGIVAEAAGHVVVAEAAVQRIVVVAAGERIVIVTAGKRVVADTAVQRVRADAAIERVVARIADELIVADRASKAVGVGVAGDLVVFVVTAAEVAPLISVRFSTLAASVAILTLEMTRVRALPGTSVTTSVATSTT